MFNDDIYFTILSCDEDKYKMKEEILLCFEQCQCELLEKILPLNLLHQFKL
jgi:hypothetical protein